MWCGLLLIVVRNILLSDGALEVNVLYDMMWQHMRDATVSSKVDDTSFFLIGLYVVVPKWLFNSDRL